MKKDEVDRKLETALSAVFGHENFRDGQLAICRAAAQGKDCVVILPTGGGKSLCYQLPAVVTKGITIVVSPLLSLIEDQTSALVSMPCGGDPPGGVPAAHLTSATPDTTSRTILGELHAIAEGNRDNRALKLLYVTPERLAMSETFRDLLEKLHRANLLARIVVDEAHCISEWGHDFRPDYRKLGQLRSFLPGVPLTALTATATRDCEDDIRNSLKINDTYHAHRTSADRPNLRFGVRDFSNKSQEDVRNAIVDVVREHAGQSGIIYCATREGGILSTVKLADYLSEKLKDVGTTALHFHAKMSTRHKRVVLAAWQKGKVDVVCATIAFGMGIDKADVRYVVHASLAKSLEGYYQEAGRAGRDDKAAECVVFYRAQDVAIWSHIFREKNEDGEDTNEESVKRRTQRLAVSRRYCTRTSGCRRKHLLEHFGDSLGPVRVGPCCDLCDASPPAPAAAPAAAAPQHGPPDADAAAAREPEVIDLLGGSDSDEI